MDPGAGRTLSRAEALVHDLGSVLNYAPRPIARKLLRRGYRRDTAAVIAEYEAARRAYLDRFLAAPPDLDTYLVSEADLSPGYQAAYVLDGRLRYGPLGTVLRRMNERVVRAIGGYHPECVIEFGSGAARNLLAVKRALPEVRCIGLELTAPSVELSQAVARHYGLAIEVRQADIMQPVADLPDATVCFSVHALEQIPDARFAFQQMHQHARRAVVLFEPIVELYGWGLRAIAARIRAHHLDRLRDLYPYLQQARYPIPIARLLPDAVNPLNPTVELHVAKEE